MICTYKGKEKEVLKRYRSLTHATIWINFEDIMLSEISKLQKDTYVSTCRRYLDRK